MAAATSMGRTYPKIIVAHAAKDKDTKAALARNSSGAVLRQVDSGIMKMLIIPSRSINAANTM